MILLSEIPNGGFSLYFKGKNFGAQPGYAYEFFCLKVGYFDFVKNILILPTYPFKC